MAPFIHLDKSFPNSTDTNLHFSHNFLANVKGSVKTSGISDPFVIQKDIYLVTKSKRMTKKHLHI